MRLIGRLLSYLIFGLGLPLWLLFRRRLRPGLWRRLGFYDGAEWPGSSSSDSPRIWFHGASAGDVRSLRPVVQRVRSAFPDAMLVVSAVTETGHRMAVDELSAVVDGVTYAPIDLPDAVGRALRAIRPDVLVLERAELWPNWLVAAQAAGVRCVLHNGRLHPDRLTLYRWLDWLFEGPIRGLDRCLMQTKRDAASVRALGVPDDRIEVTGHTKWDGATEAVGPSLPVLDGQRWLVGGSTHAADEAAVLSAFEALRRVDDEARLLLVPRYPERAPAVAEAGKRAGYEVTISTLDAGGGLSKADIVVVAALGILRSIYLSARLAIVGGSFGARGGHNVLEPAVAGVPVIAGPDLSGFQEAVSLLAGHGLIQVHDASTLGRVVVDLWRDDTLRSRLAEEVRSRVLRARGATARNAEVIIELSEHRAKIDDHVSARG